MASLLLCLRDMRLVAWTSLTVLTSCLFGCTAKVEQSSTPPPASSATATPPASQDHVVLAGRYESTNGPFTQITFYDDSHYIATKRPGTGSDVSYFTHGTYTIDPAAQTLSLKDDRTGEVISGPLHVTASDSAPTGLTNSTTPQALQPADLVGGLTNLVGGAVNLVVRGFSWLGDFLGLTGFHSSTFECSGYGMLDPSGQFVETTNLPNNPTIQLTTSRGVDGTKLLHIDSVTSTTYGTTIGTLAPQPLVNGYTRLPGGSWSAMDSDVLDGRSGYVMYQLPTGPLAFHCDPY